MGWRSQEQAHQLRKKTKPSNRSYKEGTEYEEQKGAPVRRKEYDGVVPSGLPDRFFDENGEVNLSKVGIRDAVKYMHALGFKIPPGGGAVGA